METVFYSGCSTGKLACFVSVAQTLGMNLTTFEGYTRFGHDEKQRARNQTSLSELQRIVKRSSKGARIWDVASEEAIRADDTEWAKRFGS